MVTKFVLVMDKNLEGNMYILAQALERAARRIRQGEEGGYVCEPKPKGEVTGMWSLEKVDGLDEC